MNAPRFGLPQRAVEEINAVLASHPRVEKAILYGSRAKGNHKPGSDIDLTLVGSDLVPSDLLQIENELDDLLLPQTIDLSLFSELRHEPLIDHIKRVGVAFYERTAVEAKA